MAKNQFTLAAFKEWLTEMGAIVLPETNPYEIIRVHTRDGVFVAHVNKKGKETWPAELLQIRECFAAGKHIALSPEASARRKVRHQIEALAVRDGLECWFCSMGFLSTDSREITIEHLVAKAHGGPDHPSNLVLACEPCNREADNLPLVQKVHIRDRKRSMGRSA